MNIDKPSGLDPLPNGPPAASNRPSGEASATQQVSKPETGEINRTVIPDSETGAKIDVLA